MTTFTKQAYRIAVVASFALMGRAAVAEYASIINVPPDTPPRRVLSDTQLNLLDGGILPSTYSSPFHAGRANRGDLISENSNLEVNIHGGQVGDWFHANYGSVVNISGGSVAYGFQAQGGSQVNISGGIVDWGFEAYSGSEVNISGGTIGRGFEAEPGSQVTLVGGDFKLNGATLMDSTVNFSGTDVLSGTLADGSPIIFSQLLGDNLGDVTLSRVSVPAIDLTPIVVDSDVAPGAVRDGQTLTLEEGGVLPLHFTAVNATLNIHGGYINGLAAIGSQVNIGGGDIVGLDSFDAFYGTHVVFCGGGGRTAFNAHDGSTVTVVSGLLTNIDANAGSEVTITGGVLDGSLFAYAGSEVTVLGSEFLLDGEPVTGLSGPGESLVLESRDWQVLSGMLSDGSPFEFDTVGRGFLNSQNFFDQNALLRLTLAIPGDYNGNGEVEQGDLDLVLTNWGHSMAALSSGWIAIAPDGLIDQQELDAVLLNWGTGASLGASTVPEPSAFALAFVGVALSAVATANLGVRRLRRQKWGRFPAILIGAFSQRVANDIALGGGTRASQGPPGTLFGRAGGILRKRPRGNALDRFECRHEHRVTGKCVGENARPPARPSSTGGDRTRLPLQPGPLQ